jgi:hypothetical protein
LLGFLRLFVPKRVIDGSVIKAGCLYEVLIFNAKVV